MRTFHRRRRFATPRWEGCVAVIVQVILAVAIGGATTSAAEDFVPENTQAAGEQPLPPREAAKRLRVPEGFQVTLAAAEPDVRQPIAMTFDDRGRLWVAESYSYNGSKFTDATNDRIMIFEDTTGDGGLDRRQVFCQGLTHLTGLEIGFGGVWITAPPHLSFIPDRDRDDEPDGPPVIHLDGWNVHAEHNNVNGLEWGPDGWLYGRHGIKQPSLVGTPETSIERRIELSCCIWRYHPVEHRFEIVADGTINPWGLDFDRHGHGFFTTSVVEHLWHLVPGARYERWKDRPVPAHPFAYELMAATSDHVHWASGTFDKPSRAGEGNDAFGGGHSHCDAMIYQGGRWPEKYRDAVLMSNIHGRRINCDRLVIDDNGFRGVHDDDFIVADDPWFRAVSMEYGPDGDVYLSDWSDNGECHDRDGVHRTSGRIYKISWGGPRREPVDLLSASNSRLVDYLAHANEWYPRHSRRILQERAASGDDMRDTHRRLEQLFERTDSTVQRLRAIWALHCTGGIRTQWLVARLGDPDEHVRCWAIRLLSERNDLDGLRPTAWDKLAEQDSPLVQIEFVSAIGKLPVGKRWSRLIALARRQSLWDNANLQRMIWYAMEPEVVAAPDRALDQLLHFAPRIRPWVARRVTEATAPSSELVFAKLAETNQPKRLVALLDGLDQSSVDSFTLSNPSVVRLTELIGHQNAEVRRAAVAVVSKAGGELLESLRPLLLDHATDPETARAILAGMVRHQRGGLAKDLRSLLESRHLTVDALQAAGSVKNRALIETVLGLYSNLTDYEKSAAIGMLVARKANADRLLDAIEQGRIPSSDLSAIHARQIVALGDEALSDRLESVWGSVRTSSADQAGRIRDLQASLTPDVLQNADLAAGKLLFQESCAKCHKLFGEGKILGPDLTGSQRDNLHYLLSNIVDPSAAVPADFRMSVVLTSDGRVITGVLTEQNDSGVTIRTLEDSVRIAEEDVERIRNTSASMMPDGLIDKMSPDQIRDLIGWLMSDGANANDESAFVPVFNDKDLSGWDGQPGAWEVREGEIWCTGNAKSKNWLIWRGGQPRDFVLRMEFRWDSGNSGVQVRSDDLGNRMVSGYQVEVAEQDAMGLWHHSLLANDHPRKGVRHRMATAGQSVTLAPDGSKSVRNESDPGQVRQVYREHEWNDLEIVVDGDTLVQKINGVTFSTVTDLDREWGRKKGVVALQDHGKGCRVGFRNIRIRHGG